MIFGKLFGFTRLLVGMATGKFNLKWNDFQTNVSKSFGIFRNESYLHDVTLVSDDFKQIPAHKLVLSATSEYFKNILQETKQSQPMICLDGVNSEDLGNVLDYLYDGEVKISQDDLDRFLKIAEKLKLQGLLSNNKSDGDYGMENEMSTEEYEKIFSVDDHRNVSKSELRSEFKTSNKSETKILALSDSGEEVSMEDHKQRISENVEVNSNGTATCKVCGRTFGGSKSNAKINARRHVESHIEGLTYSCSKCDITFRSKRTLENHRYQNFCHFD